MMPSSARAYDPSEDLHAIHVPADPNGLAYDRNDDTLYIADGDRGAVLAIEQGRRRRVATIDSAGIVANNRLGGIAVAPDGTLYVARLGHGHAGAIFRIENGAVTELAHLSPRAWRLGVAYDAAEHALYATEFHKVVTGPCDGAVVRIDLVTGDTAAVIDGFQKPVGVAKLGSTLVVTDARQRAVYRVELAGGRAVLCSQLATDLDRPDSIAACDLDSVLVTTYDPETRVGSVRQIWLDGLTRTIARGDWEPRGIATDGERAFVSVRGRGRVLVLRI
jgi:DNA-binding beta-propeller fold protein YncE